MDDNLFTAAGSKDFLELLGTHFLICNEKILTRGEDCGFEAYTVEAGIMGAFDGCGGLGSKTCSAISGKTEAYLASRAVGNAVRMWFDACASFGYKWDSDLLKKYIISNLTVCQKNSGEEVSKLRGTMVRSFPSTIAAVAFSIDKEGLKSEHIWAGDSRTYILDYYGLAQISEDDIKGEDAMSNLTRDGALTNVLSADEKFILHTRTFPIKHPCMVIAASDGCFGYVSSPMEFELMLLESLIKAPNVDIWQKSLNEEISKRSGDDQTIAIAAFGFDDFVSVQEYFRNRYEAVSDIVRRFNAAEPDKGISFWESYKPNYYRYAVREE
ncbi:hypothetical protein [Oribacterium sp. FC2011]|uniref:hypothetical protein n=1 Tax=Oribacterium sp. FC2011 TaxID=1408311 RepID=UPI0004E282BF|nr:hypothetical protein [Oribacterium sp. FC2011]